MKSKQIVPAVVFAILLIGGASAQAGTVISFPDFTNACSTLTCVGSAATVGPVLRVTPAAIGQSGAAYSTTPITLGINATFSTTFQFQFTDTGGIDPADGITFVLAQNSTGLGTGGGDLGYGTVTNSVAIEFDTFFNGGVDTDSNHVAIDTDGNLNDLALADPYGVSACDFGSGHSQVGCMSNGDVWTATIGYDGTNLSVSVQDGANAVQNVITNFAIDIASHLGQNTAFVGFTGGTGSGFENQDILNWQFANDTSLAPSVPEPASLLLLGSGLAGLAYWRRKQAA